MQVWTEEVLESNKTLFLCLSLCVYIFYDMARKQFLQLKNLNLFFYSKISINFFHLQ